MPELPAVTLPDATYQQEYPFESHWFTTNANEQIHYVDQGQGETLLFVHGNPTWSFAWRKLIGHFGSSYRCVAIDHLGCGLSEKAEQASYRLADHVDRLKQLIEHLNLENVTLVAHDWGGAIGMGAAVALKERFSRLVLLNTAAFRSDDIPFRIAVCRIPGLGSLALRGGNLFVRAALSQAVSRQSQLQGVARAGMLAPYYDWKSRRAVDEFVKDIPLMPDHPSYETLRQIEAGLEQFSSTPILLPWGMKDWCFHPGFLRRFQEFWPHAQSAEFDDAGHYLFEDAPDELIKVIETFLKK